MGVTNRIPGRCSLVFTCSVRTQAPSVEKRSEVEEWSLSRLIPCARGFESRPRHQLSARMLPVSIRGAWCNGEHAGFQVQWSGFESCRPCRELCLFLVLVSFRCWFRFSARAAILQASTTPGQVRIETVRVAATNVASQTRTTKQSDEACRGHTSCKQYGADSAALESPKGRTEAAMREAEKTVRSSVS